MPWSEFVHVEARYFVTGEHPWTNEDFYVNSVPQSEVAPTTDPIVATIFAHEGPRAAESSGWWDEGYLWYPPLALDTDHRLTKAIIRFGLTILETGKSDSDGTMGLLNYLCESDGFDWVFRDYLVALESIANKLRKPDSIRVCFLTLWSCDAGRQYIPGEPDEYYEDWQLIGVVHPVVDGVCYEALEDDITCEIEDDPPLNLG